MHDEEVISEHAVGNLNEIYRLSLRKLSIPPETSLIKQEMRNRRAAWWIKKFMKPIIWCKRSAYFH